MEKERCVCVWGAGGGANGRRKGGTPNGRRNRGTPNGRRKVGPIMEEEK